MHFKLSDQSIVDQATDGKQQSTLENWRSSFYDLGKPEGWEGFSLGIKKELINDFGNDPQGGLINSPFGIKGTAYWTIASENKASDGGSSAKVFECGTYHRDNTKSDSANAAMTKTVHKVFFRGKPPSEEDVRRRMLSLINKSGGKLLNS